MTRPKTYGEFAETNEYTRVDERLRDREISDDAWRILNMHNEIPEKVKEHFDIKDVTQSYVDYYDDNSVTIIAMTKDCYEPIMMSAVVGDIGDNDRFDVSVDSLTKWDRCTIGYPGNADYVFAQLGETLIDSIERDEALREMERKSFEEDCKYDPEFAAKHGNVNPYLCDRSIYYDMDDEVAYAFEERFHRYIQSKFEQIEGAEIVQNEYGNGSDTNIDRRVKVQWPNPEREGETLIRRFEVYTNGGCIELEHEDSVDYMSDKPGVPLSVQYYNCYGRDEHGIPYDKDDIHASFDALKAKVDALMEKPPVRETVLPKDLRYLHDFSLSDVSPHAKEVLGVGNERLYIYTYENSDGTAGYTSASLTLARGDSTYDYLGTRMQLLHKGGEDEPEWTVKLVSEVGEGINITSTVDKSEWKREFDNVRRTFGEFLEGEYYRTAVSDLNDQNEIQQ